MATVATNLLSEEEKTAKDDPSVLLPDIKAGSEDFTVDEMASTNHVAAAAAVTASSPREVHDEAIGKLSDEMVVELKEKIAKAGIEPSVPVPAVSVQKSPEAESAPAVVKTSTASTAPASVMPPLPSKKASEPHPTDSPKATIAPAPEPLPTSPLKSPPPLNSRSERRQPLSELSKQLRLLQAKNQAQGTEIDRLERQVKILSDLHNVSVAELRDALTSACQAEAHAELHNRISFLSASLEAAELMASKQQQRSSPADKQEIANLQLRVGELEELEETMRSEIQGLYKKLTAQTAKATRLEAACERQQEQIQTLQEEAASAASSSKDNDDTKEAEAKPIQTVSAAVVLQQQQQQHAAVEKQVESEKVALLESQLQSAEQQHSLRQAQFKARFAVQEENIHDLKQQLSSLYVAFGMLKQEREEDAKVNAALKSFLDEADAQVAHQTDHLERASLSGNSPAAIQREINRTPLVSSAASTSPPQTPVSSGRPQKSILVSPVAGDAPPTPPASAPPTPPAAAAKASPATASSPTVTPDTPLSSSHRSNTSNSSTPGQKVMAGTLLLRSASGMIKRWKKRQAVLYVKFTHYQLVLQPEASSSSPPISLDLTVGVSAVYPYVNHKHAFSVHSNAYNSVQCQTVFCAAPNAEEYQKWIQALETATTGVPTVDGQDSGTPNPSVAPPRRLSAEEQEARDLELALEISETDH